jgi:hypothetical protein
LKGFEELLLNEDGELAGKLTPPKSGETFLVGFDGDQPTFLISNKSSFPLWRGGGMGGIFQLLLYVLKWVCLYHHRFII